MLCMALLIQSNDLPKVYLEVHVKVIRAHEMREVSTPRPQLRDLGPWVILPRLLPHRRRRYAVRVVLRREHHRHTRVIEQPLRVYRHGHCVREREAGDKLAVRHRVDLRRHKVDCLGQRRREVHVRERRQDVALEHERGHDLEDALQPRVVVEPLRVADGVHEDEGVHGVGVPRGEHLGEEPPELETEDVRLEDAEGLEELVEGLDPDVVVVEDEVHGLAGDEAEPLGAQRDVLVEESRDRTLEAGDQHNGVGLCAFLGAVVKVFPLYVLVEGALVHDIHLGQGGPGPEQLVLLDIVHSFAKVLFALFFCVCAA